MNVDLRIQCRSAAGHEFPYSGSNVLNLVLMKIEDGCGSDGTVSANNARDEDYNHYNNRPFPWRIVGPFPSDMSLGKGIPSDLSLGNARWGSFVRDSFPSDNPQRRGGSHSFFSQGTSATVAHFSPATCRWGICG
ncbi:hypothetical protein Tco_1187579 [Tanacetum coccineum]